MVGGGSAPFWSFLPVFIPAIVLYLPELVPC
jgi:hypothetical protein